MLFSRHPLSPLRNTSQLCSLLEERPFECFRQRVLICQYNHTAFIHVFHTICMRPILCPMIRTHVVRQLFLHPENINQFLPGLTRNKSQIITGFDLSSMILVPDTFAFRHNLTQKLGKIWTGLRSLWTHSSVIIFWFWHGLNKGIGLIHILIHIFASISLFNQK